MRTLIILVMVLSLAAGLSSCTKDEKTAGLTPLPSEDAGAEPDDVTLRADITKFLQDTGAPVSSQYDFRRVDLDGDTRRDALVLFKNPYGYWCGLYGCAMLILKAQDGGFDLVSAVQSVRGPVYVGDAKTNGWKDILVHVSGRWSKTKDVALQFDGEKYPSVPNELPVFPRLALRNEVELF